MISRHWQTTGAIWPCGVSTSMTWLDFGALITLLQRFAIRAIVEIGVEHGGCTAPLSSYARYTGVAYWGIDRSLASLSPAVAQHDGALLVERDAWAAETVAEVGAWIAAHPVPSLIFCDGGDKPHELRLYAPLLRSGDILVGHDYRNEYMDDALWGLPDDLERLQADWLDDVLLCAFRRGHD